MVNLTACRHHILHGDGTKKSSRQNAWESGLQRECLYIESPEPPYFIAASLHPDCAAALTSVDAACFAETVRELNADPAYSALRRLANWPARFRTVSAFLGEQSGRPNVPIVYAVGTNTDSGGAVPIQSISANSATATCTSSHVHPRCWPPLKRFTRLIRLERAITESKSQPVNGTAVARECVFHDLGHFNREWKRFAGVTPTGFFVLATREASGQAIAQK